MSDKHYHPIEHSIVQGLIRNEPHEQYEATDFHEALLFAIAREIGLVHYNRYQKAWNRWSDDPHIPGIQWRRYVYDCDCPESDDGFIPRHRDDCPSCQPNFSFENVRFSWYKNPGRGMSMNQSWPPEKWAEWFDRCIAKIREFDVQSPSGTRSIRPIPDEGHFHSAACHVMFAPAIERPPLRDELLSMKDWAERGQRQIAKGRSDSEGYWRLVERGDMSERDTRLIALGIMAERYRAQQAR